MAKTKITFIKADYVKAVVAGLFCSSLGMATSHAQSNASDTTTTTKKSEAKVHCYGINECSGKGACHTASHACAGKNSCKGKGWVLKTQQECESAGGKVKPKAKKTEA